MQELIASSHTVDEIRDYIQADSLAYLSHAGLMRVAHAENQAYCSACFTGRYPVEGPWQDHLIQLSLFDKQRR